MLNFLPIFLVLLTFIGLLVLRSMHVPLGMTWLILVIFSLLNWGALLLLRSYLPKALVIQNWFPLAISKDPFVLQIDPTNWLLIFALVSLVVGILFASSAHLQEQNIFSTWLQVLSLTVVGLLALMANSLLAFVIFWALLDIVEILVFTLITAEQNVSVQTYAIFIGRMLGLGLVILAMAFPTGTPLPADLTAVTGVQLILLIVGASLRLGVLPIHLPYTRDLLKRRSLSTILRILAPLSTFSFLAKLAALQSITGINLLIMLLAIVSSLFGSVNWLLAQNELEGRPYWILSFSGFAMISYLHGQSDGVLVWGVLMVIIGGWVFLSEANSRKMDFLLPVILLTLTGLPFTPAVAGLVGISTGPLSIFNPLLWVSLAILMAGLVKFSYSGGDSQHPYESWMRFFFSIGMSLMVLSSWSILLFKNLGWNQVRYWWVSLFVLTIFSGILVYTYVKKARQEVRASRVFSSIQSISPFWQVINRFFHFDWLYHLLGFLFSVQKAVVGGFNLVFEGESGVLWALVFLVLLVSLLINGKGGL